MYYDMADTGKIIIVSAPSGTGKSTIISRIIDDPKLALGFSVSCTSRAPRTGETEGKDYYFVSPEEFARRVGDDRFIEWEEVYPGTCYGTLASEVERVTGQGRNLILDIDVKGALNVKERYGDRAMSVFIMPPSLEVLGRRLLRKFRPASHRSCLSGLMDSTVLCLCGRGLASGLAPQSVETAGHRSPGRRPSGYGDSCGRHTAGSACQRL